MKRELRFFLLYVTALAGCTEEGDISYQEYSNLEYIDTKLESATGPALVTSIVEGSDGTIWLGTSSGISKMSENNVDVVINDLRVFVRSTLRDSKNNIWFGTIDGPLLFDGNEWIRSPIFLENPWIYVNAIIEASDGKIWLGTNCCGVLVIDDIYTEEPVQYFDYSCDECNDILSLLEDNNGHIWAGSRENLKKFDGLSFVTIGAADGFLNSAQVTSLFQDSWGLLWIGTEEGLFTLRDNSFTKFPGSFKVYSATDIVERADGNIYVGTLNNGLWWYNGVSLYQRLIAPGDDSYRWDQVNGVLKDSKDRIWIATNAGAIKMNK